MKGTSIFNFGTLLGDPDYQNLMQRVDDLSSGLSKQSNASTSVVNNDKILNDIITLISSEETDPRSIENAPSNGVQQLLQNLTVPAERTNRYKAYDELYSSVQLIKRIVRVYSNNILQKDIITGNSLTILETTKFNSNTANVNNLKTFAQSIIKHFKLEKQLSNRIIQDLLRYGDSYIEIINLREDVFDLPDSTTKTGTNSNQANQQVINEAIQAQHDIDYLKKLQVLSGNSETVINEALDKFIDYFVDFDSLQYNATEQAIVEGDGFIDSILPKNQKNETSKLQLANFKPSNLNQFLLRYHSPKTIVNLTTTYNDSVLGYVEIREQAGIERVPGIGLQFATVLKQISTTSKDKSEDVNGLTRRIVHKLITKIIDKSGVKKKFSNKKNSKEINAEFEKTLMTKIGDDLFYMVKRLYNESDQEANTKSKLAIRFMPPDNVIHLCLNPIEFAPYGTSIIDPLIYPAKLYLLTQLTNMVTKLSRASLIRKWTIESGPREHGTNLLQKLKREIRNQRITVDDIVSFKSIPKILSDFKDMMILTKKGVKFVDVDIQPIGDANIKIADLEDTRKEIVALSGIPAPYLGYNDVVDLREQLVNINITFATELISIQSIINEGITALADKLADRLGFEDVPSDFISIALKPPVILLLQMLESTMSSIGNIQMSLQSVNVDFNPYYLLKKFIPNIDWDEFSSEAKEFALYKKAQTPPVPTDGM